METFGPTPMQRLTVSSATEGFGTVYGDTKRMREEFDLGDHLLVLRVDDEEFAWCLDCSQTAQGGVVSVLLGSSEPPVQVSDTFDDYFRNYVNDQLSIAEMR